MNVKNVGGLFLVNLTLSPTIVQNLRNNYPAYLATNVCQFGAPLACNLIDF